MWSAMTCPTSLSLLPDPQWSLNQALPLFCPCPHSPHGSCSFSFSSVLFPHVYLDIPLPIKSTKPSERHLKDLLLHEAPTPPSFGQSSTISLSCQVPSVMGITQLNALLHFVWCFTHKSYLSNWFLRTLGQKYHLCLGDHPIT